MRYKKWIYFTAKVFLLLFFLYVFSFTFLAYFGKRESFSWDGKVWSFRGTRQSADYHYPNSKDFQPELLENEKRLCQFYRPLIQLDARLTKDKHIYYEIAPECGR